MEVDKSWRVLIRGDDNWSELIGFDENLWKSTKVFDNISFKTLLYKDSSDKI